MSSRCPAVFARTSAGGWCSTPGGPSTSGNGRATRSTASRPTTSSGRTSPTRGTRSGGRPGRYGGTPCGPGTRSGRVRVSADGTLLADAPSCVTVFETGLPTRYYVDRVHVDFTRLVPSDTVTSCPYKGTTGGYWSAVTAAGTHQDIVWSYTFPTRQLLPIAGLVCFYNE